MQERIEGYVPYNNNMYGKIVLFMLGGEFSWGSGTIIELLIHYGIIHVKFDKTRFIHEIIWECGGCSARICNSRTMRNKFKTILSHIGTSKLPYDTPFGSLGRNKGPGCEVKVYLKFKSVIYKDYKNLTKKLDEDDILLISRMLTLYSPMLTVCVTCESILYEGLRIADEILVKHYLKHIINDMNAESIKCRGNVDDEFGGKNDFFAFLSCFYKIEFGNIDDTSKPDI